MMASNCLFLSLVFLLIICSSGTLVGFSYAEACSFLQLNKVKASQIPVLAADIVVLSDLSNPDVFVDLHLNESSVEDLRRSNSSAVSCLKTLLLGHVDLRRIIVARIDDGFGGQRQIELVKLLSSLKSIHSILTSFNLQREVKVSLAFSLFMLQKMKNTMHGRDMDRVLDFIKKTGSSVVVEAIVDGEVSFMGDRFVQSVMEAASVATLSVPVPIVLVMKIPAVYGGAEVAEFTAKVKKSLRNNVEIATRIEVVYTQVSAMEDSAQKEKIFTSSGRELLSTGIVHKTVHDVSIPPPTTTFPTAPESVPPNNQTPAVVTVPSTNPVTVTPTNSGIPATTPVTVPSANTNNPTVPINTPPAVPVPGAGAPPAPVSVPGAGAPPITNPVTTYPPPTAGVPVSTPVTNPVPPPAPPTTNAPAIPGQSWCVAKSGASETTLQAALDYACGTGSVDCSQIQQGANCYNPNTLQNHASYAFNSYYQKNPSPTSCDFGGAANIVNTNPSSGSCVYPSSASKSTPATPATTSTTGAGVPGSASPPAVLNSSSPVSGSGATTVFGFDTPPSVNTSTSLSAGVQPLINPVVMVISFVAGVTFTYV